MESWGSSKSLESSAKLKLLLGGTILPNFSKYLQFQRYCRSRNVQNADPEFTDQSLLTKFTANNSGLAQTN